MSFIQPTALRHLGRYTTRHICPFKQQCRWAQVHDVRFLATTRPYANTMDRYKAQLDQKAQAEGYGTVEEMKKAYADMIQAVRRKDAVEFPDAQQIPQAPKTPVKQPYKGDLSIPEPEPEPEPEANKETTIPQAPKTPVNQPNKGPLDPTIRKASSSGKPAIKGLDDIIDLSKARELPERELTTIWRLRHAHSENNICAVVPASAYRAMEEAARVSPQFVLPVPHESQGAEMHFLQWVWDVESKTSTVLFTQLAEYKTRGEFAQPHTTVTHHLDLVNERGLVLLQGQVVNDGVCKPQQAKWLLTCLQRFYGGWEGDGQELMGERKQRAEERKKLLYYFAMGDPRFSVEKLIEEAERMG